MTESVCTPTDRPLAGVAAAGADTKFKWMTIAVLIGSVAATCLARGLTVPVGDVLGLLALTVPLGLAAARLSARGCHNVAFCLIAVIEFTAFTCSYTAVSGLVLMAGRPLADAWLVRCDALLGLHLPTLAAWTVQHPWGRAILAFSYHTVVPQTLVTIFLLGMSGRRVKVQKFLLRLMVAALITLMLFAAYPAAGPFASYGLEPDAMQREYLQYFHQFRTDDRPAPRFFILQGLITFPSFHAAWAVVLTAAHWRHLRWRIAWVILNVAVILSTPVIGAHYVTDVVAGIAIGLIAVVSTKGCSNAFWGREVGPMDSFDRRAPSVHAGRNRRRK